MQKNEFFEEFFADDGVRAAFEALDDENLDQKINSEAFKDGPALRDGGKACIMQIALLSQEANMNSEVLNLIDFIENSPTAFHAVENICNALDDAGFERLQEREIWQIQPGGSYYFTRNRSSVVAFTIPCCGLTHFQIIASHSDSPAFKIKPNANRDGAGHYAQLNTEKYGGMLMNTWFDRPLSLAGRLLVRDGAGVSTHLVNVDRDIAMIPNMPIHFNRQANDGVALSAQTDLMPVYGTKGCQNYMDLAAEAAGVDAEKIVGSDLFLYSRSMACVWGADEAYFSAGRIDDLECAYTTLRAFLTAEGRDHINMMCVMDNEEVGSGTKQGADSTLLSETVRRIALALEAPQQALEVALAGSFMLSADNAHAVHPNHPEKYDQENRVFMNEGVVVKFNANQRYTSDGVSAAIFEQICQDAGVPTQRFANHSDVAGGSTLGNIANAHVSMNTVDIGLAQLAMHSAYETAGVRDVDYMLSAMRAFYEAEIEIRADGELTIS